jgi:hypothetical protein
MSHPIVTEEKMWSPKVIRATREHDVEADDEGRMIKLPNFKKLNTQLLEEMVNS